MATSLQPDAEHEQSRRTSHQRARMQRYVLAGCGITTLMACGLMLYFVSSLFHTLLVDSASDFKFYTGLAMPEGASVVRTGDDHGGFQGDGEFYLVFEADPEALSKWLADAPPWGKSWQAGPLPSEMTFQNMFGWQESGLLDLPEPDAHLNPDRAENVLNSTRVRYSAEERCCQTLPWHNGSLLIVDPESGYVWLSVWDF
jgi:hypothetical protein